MIHAYVPRDGAVDRYEIQTGQLVPGGAVWIDLIEPVDDERKRVEKILGIELPTRDEMLEIEPSSRLYQDGGAWCMTATVITNADQPDPSSDVITFVLTRERLVTLRYVDPRPIRTFAARLVKHPGLCSAPEDALLGLVDSFIDRIADILERVAFELDALSRSIFHSDRKRSQGEMREVLRALSRHEDLASTSRESLLSLSRLVRFAGEAISNTSTKDRKPHLAAIAADITSLSEHATFQANKVVFLLDAVLGLINIEQNAIIKIFSVLAIVLMPPTLIASIYGMNFRFMPELDRPFGYPLALGLMALSAAVPYRVFKRKGWL